MVPRISRFATAAVLQLAALFLAHQLVYLARYGSRFGEALIHSGHREAWTGAVISVAVLTLVVAAIAVARLVRLGLLVRRWGGLSSGGPVGPLERASLARAWLRLAPRMIALSLVLLTVQENLEQAAIGATATGPGILFSPEYAGGAWIAVGVALLVSLVAALFAWRRRVLLALLRALRDRPPRGAPVVHRPTSRDGQPIGSELGRRSALRAPPSGVFA